ncbi:MAG: hypothetical protein H7Y10_12295 [Flavobacterium sp.]|nr:hypothetical protein [Flavobacterium sp.]
MSINTRRKVAYWFMLILGIGLLCLQFKKYYFNTLEFSIEEFIVTMVAVVMAINPLFFLESLSKFINSKTNEKNEP